MDIARALLRPRSVAVVGASREPHKVGHIILKNILESGFPGKVYPVNPKADTILGLKCYATVLDIPDEIDLAVVAVPARVVPEIVEQCGQKRVPVVIVISAGFKETGPEGARLEQEIVSIARRYGIRIIGPNCLGYMNLDVPINATFAATTPSRGPIALISQSGAVITALLDIATQLGVGFSKVFSLGNKADISEVELLQVLKQDENTRYIVMYVESIERGQEFIRIAREVSREKLVVVLKAGITERGARAVSSHTGSLAGSATVYAAAFKQAGVIQISGLRQLVALLKLLSTKLDLRALGRLSTVIVTNAGGPGIIATDLCEQLGVELAVLEPEVISRLREVLPPAAALHNPVDVLGDATPERYESALRIVLSSPSVNCVLVIATPQATTRPLELAEKLVKLAESYPDKLVVTVLLGGEAMREAYEKLARAGLPVYTSIEDAVEALSIVNKYAELRSKLVEEELTLPELDLQHVVEIINSARRDGRKVLLLSEALDLARTIGIPVPEGRLATSAEEAVKIAHELGYPVVLRIVSPDIIHKSDIGGVKLNLRRDEDVERAFYEIIDTATRYAPYARIYGVHVSKMVEGRYEVFIGATRDPHFGPVIVFGLGGVYVELFRDVSMRIAPLSRRDAYEMISETKIGAILRGYRGAKPVNLENIVDVLVRVSSLMVQVPDIVELDINPLLVSEDKVYAVDVKVVVR